MFSSLTWSTRCFSFLCSCLLSSHFANAFQPTLKTELTSALDATTVTQLMLALPLAYSLPDSSPV